MTGSWHTAAMIRTVYFLEKEQMGVSQRLTWSPLIVYTQQPVAISIKPHYSLPSWLNQEEGKSISAGVERFDVTSSQIGMNLVQGR